MRVRMLVNAFVATADAIGPLTRHWQCWDGPYQVWKERDNTYEPPIAVPTELQASRATTLRSHLQLPSSTRVPASRFRDAPAVNRSGSASGASSGASSGTWLSPPGQNAQSELSHASEVKRWHQSIHEPDPSSQLPTGATICRNLHEKWMPSQSLFPQRTRSGVASALELYKSRFDVDEEPLTQAQKEVSLTPTAYSAGPCVHTVCVL